MFIRPTAHVSQARSAFVIAGLVFHGAVRNVRKTHHNAVVGVLINMGQSLALLAGFYLSFEFFGMRSMAVRGDYLLYLMSGIFVFMMHVKTAGAVFGAEGPASPMMMHAPMNTTIAILSAALGALYTQVLSALVIIGAYHAAVTPVEINEPVGAFLMLLLAWFSGVGVGMVFVGMRPWSPRLASVLKQGYARINMIASGKMFLANNMPAALRDLFDWNPLFHIIDQGRGYLFLNYVPHYTNATHALVFTFVCLVLGLMGEFFTRRRASASWSVWY